MISRTFTPSNMRGASVKTSALGTTWPASPRRGALRLDNDPRTAAEGSPNVAQVEHQLATTAGDEQLIGAVAQGHQDAFEMIYDRYAPIVFGFALKMLGARDAAEEAVQEVFWRVWQRAASFDPQRAFAPWLFRIAHNYCIDELRRRRVRSQSVYEGYEHPVLTAIPDDTDVGETVMQAEQCRSVTHALQQLPVEQRQPLELAYFGGFTQQAIAEYLGNPLGTIKTRQRLGLQKLRKMLQGQGLVEA